MESVFIVLAPLATGLIDGLQTPAKMGGSLFIA
jgi:hypothetical protein